MEDSSHALLCEFKKACYWNGRSISALRRRVLGHTLSGAGLWEVSLIKGQLLPASCPSRLRVNRPAWCNNLGSGPVALCIPLLLFFSSLAHRGCLDQAAWPSSLGRALGGVSCATGEASLQSAPLPSRPIKPVVHVATCRQGGAREDLLSLWKLRGACHHLV